jgi:hypothetical protein
VRAFIGGVGLAKVGVEKAKWLAGRPTHGRPAMDSHATDSSKSANSSSGAKQCPRQISSGTDAIEGRPAIGLDPPATL